MSLQRSCPKLVAYPPVQETSIARRRPRGRTHFAGTRRTFPGTSQGVPRGEALPLGEVSWNGTGYSLPIWYSSSLDSTILPVAASTSTFTSFPSFVMMSNSNEASPFGSISYSTSLISPG